MIVRPKPVRKIVATFANGTPSPVCSHAAHARERARPDLRGRRSQGRRGLPRGAALGPAPTAPTPAYVHVERRHVRAHRREIGLVLDIDALAADRSAARGALGRGQHLDDLVDVVGDRAPRPRAVRPPGLAVRPPRARTRRPLRERRRRPLRGPPCCLELLLQRVPLPLVAIALTLHACNRPPQPLVLFPQPLLLAALLAELLLAVLTPLRRPPPHHRHADKKAYLDPRIYNAVRREALTKDAAY